MIDGRIIGNIERIARLSILFRQHSPVTTRTPEDQHGKEVGQKQTAKRCEEGKGQRAGCSEFHNVDPRQNLV